MNNLPLNDKKVYAFEFLINELLRWHCEFYRKNFSDIIENDLSVLKVLKLLFFTTAASIKRDGSSYLLETVFNKFYALPYGHVESEVYDLIKKNNGNLNFFEINNQCTIRKENALSRIKDLIDLTPIEIRTQILESIRNLKQINYELISYSAYKLVDLSHIWYSWQFNFDGYSSSKISIDLIKSEDKIFVL